MDMDSNDLGPLFPELPEDLSALSDDDLQVLLDEHLAAVEMIDADDPKFIGDLPATEVLAQYESGKDQIKQIRAEQTARKDAEAEYLAKKAELRAEIDAELAAGAEEPAEDDDSEDGDDGDAEAVEELSAEEEPESVEEAVAEVVAEAEEATAEAAVEPEKPAVVASAKAPVRMYRRPPAPSRERQAGEQEPQTATLIAAAGVEGVRSGVHLDRLGLAEAMIEHVKRRSRPSKHEGGVEEKTLIASAAYPFPKERVLLPNDPDGNSFKIRSVGTPFLGVDGQKTLVASGGLCAPLTPLYDIPDVAVMDRPVRGALPSFQAERGGVSVPSVSTIGDITTAITVIEEDEDALGGTFATKSCQDLTCPTWTDVAVGIISHCREYGNLNSRAWPEGIAHENTLTMAAHARTAEARLLDRIKALSVSTTNTQTLGALIDLVYMLTRTTASMRYVLRLAENTRFRALIPAWLPELLQVDFASNPFDRVKTREQISQVLRAYMIEPTYYLDTPSTGTSQAFSAEVDSSAADDFPADAQIAVFPEGTFLHLDGGTLELGIVRDSTLNSTNDYQVFGETFENVARIGPTQAARWLTASLCPTGELPSLATALSCGG